MRVDSASIRSVWFLADHRGDSQSVSIHPFQHGYTFSSARRNPACVIPSAILPQAIQRHTPDLSKGTRRPLFPSAIRAASGNHLLLPFHTPKKAVDIHYEPLVAALADHLHLVSAHHTEPQPAVFHRF